MSKTLLTLAALFLSLALTPAVSHAAPSEEGWTARLTCEQGGLVIDGYHTFAQGFISHQVVIRNSLAAQQFNHVAAAQSPTANTTNLPLNQNGELIVALATPSFDGSFDQRIADVRNADSSSGGTILEMHGQWLDGGRYQVELTGLNYYPGMDTHQPALLTDWIFNDCQWIR